MNVVFIHQNFPGQFRHIASNLAIDSRNQVVSISQGHAPKLQAIKNLVYRPARSVTEGVHPYLASTEAYILNGQAVARLLLGLKNKGFRPDVIFAHASWGEALYVKDIFPDTPLVGFFEFFYRASGADVGFDPAYPLDLDGALRVRTRNAIHLLTLEAVDFGITPTKWQRSVFPCEYWTKLNVIHEGVLTVCEKDGLRPVIDLPNGGKLSTDNQVVTYVSRNLEPYRGFHIFMRAAAEICRRNPRAHVVIVGGDEVSYGNRLPNGETYRNKLLAEVKIDAERLHFLGRVSYQDYLKVLLVSSVHVYLTVPFVLSWSMLEAMSAGCLVVGSDTPPVQEVICNKKNGILVDFFSPNEIADIVSRALDKPIEFQSLRDSGRRTVVEEYSIARGIEGYRGLISRIGDS